MLDAAETKNAPSRRLVFVLAFACGAGAANLYYSQPLAGPIAQSLGLTLSAAGLVVTLTQIGYAAGLFLLVPLGDLKENRRLITVTISTAAAALLLAAAATTAPVFLAASLLIGLTSVGVQMLVPLAAYLAPAAMRGRVVGTVMSGLLIGILLARPLASLIAAAFGWRAVFAASAVLMMGVALVLRSTLPRRHPESGESYGRLLKSLWPLLVSTPILQRRTFYQTMLFASFALFWTSAPLLLAAPPFHLGQVGIAAFALAGAAGAIAAPIAGRLADAGWSRLSTGLSLALVAAAFASSGLAVARQSVVMLAMAGVMLDFGVQSNQVLGQRAIYALAGGLRSRLNGIYIGLFFGGGAVGSAIAGPTLAHGGWRAVCWFGTAAPAAALLVYVSEFREAAAEG